MRTSRIIVFFLFTLMATGLSAEPNDDLLAAVVKGDLPAVQAAVKAGAVPDEFEDKGGYTALMSAVYRGNKPIVQYLVEKAETKADVNYQSSSGMTPLMSAAYADKPEMASYLLGKGAKIDPVDFDKKTALHYAAESGSAGVLKILLAKKAALNAVDRSGWTALMAAVVENRPAAVQYLLAQGADPNVRARAGFSKSTADWHCEFYEDDTALSLARNRNLPDIVKMLEKAKAKVFYANTLNDGLVKEKLGSFSVKMEMADQKAFEEFTTILAGTFKGAKDEAAKLDALKKVQYEEGKFILMRFKYAKKPEQANMGLSLMDGEGNALKGSFNSYTATNRSGDTVTGYETVFLITLAQACTVENFPANRQPVQVKLNLIDKDHYFAKFFYPAK